MNVRRWLTLVALTHVSGSTGCLGDCGEDDGVRTVVRSQAAALEDLSRLADSVFCGEVCSSAALTGGVSPDERVDACMFDPVTSELECIFLTDAGNDRSERVPAGSIGPQHLFQTPWTEIERRLDDGQSFESEAPYEPGSSVDCELVLGATLLDQRLACMVIEDCSAGRRPRALAGHRPRVRRDLDPRIQWWSTVAALEEAAVEAFGELARDLAHLEAPAELVKRAVEARRDEIRHARLCRRQAGESPAMWPAVAPVGRLRPSLETLARHNAAEGCIREAFAALEVLVQSQRSSCPRTAAILRGIADDELRHAALSWDIDAWARSRLGRRSRRSVRQARRRALQDLLRPDPSLPMRTRTDPILGLQGAGDRARLVRRFAATVPA